MRLFQLFLLSLIRFYQLAVSPWVSRGRCRFEPTCSCYAHVCISRFGPLKGTWMAAKRVARCHPFGAFGFDPPPTLTEEVKESG